MPPGCMDAPGVPVTFGVSIGVADAAGLVVADGFTVAVATGLTVLPGDVVVLLFLLVHPTNTELNKTTTMIAINSFFIKYASFCIYSLQEDATLSIKNMLTLSNKFAQYARLRHNALIAEA